MQWTMRKLVEKAYGASGLGSLGLSPEMYEEGLSSLVAMILDWESSGLRLAFNRDGELDDDSGIPDYAFRAVFMNLGIELAANKGREVSPRIAAMASSALDRLKSRDSAPIPMRLPGTLPAGAGNRHTGRKYIQDENDNLNIGTDDELEFK